MTGFRKIMVAVDLGEVSAEICGRGVDLARHYDAEVTLIHVIEPIIVEPVYDMMPAVPFELELRHLEAAKRQLEELGGEFAIDPAHCLVQTGATKAELIRLAEEMGADVIVVGSHSRHGVVGRLLGSTAASVLHAASCDVLAVRVRQ